MAFASVICAFMLLALLAEVIIRCVSSFSAGAGSSFWSEWLPSHLLNTAVTAALSVSIALPLGLLLALYIVIYSGKRLSAALKTVISALCCIPSAVYGLFGFFLFSKFAMMRYSVAAGVITLSVLLLSTAARCCLEAVCRVDEKLTAASLALGATQAETVKNILLPACFRGIAFAAVLCLSKAAGESASLIFTCGTGKANIKNGLFGYLFSSGETLAVGIYQAVLNGELPLAFAGCGFVLLLMTVFDILSGIWRCDDDRS